MYNICVYFIYIYTHINTQINMYIYDEKKERQKANEKNVNSEYK